MALDLLAIADALAARFDSAQITPPTNPDTSVAYPNIRLASARLPNNIPSFPAVGIFPPEPGDASFTIGGGQRVAEMEFTIRFFYGEMTGDLPRHMIALYRWWGVLLDQLNSGMKLGLATVRKAIVISSGIGVYTYAGVEHGIIEIKVQVTTEDTVVLTP
jgi:hypothetical protein